jgi:predicted NBD/HSP70 family sugar kinase
MCDNRWRGIWMGIIINGQIYRGKGGGAGEFGHLVVIKMACL